MQHAVQHAAQHAQQHAVQHVQQHAQHHTTQYATQHAIQHDTQHATQHAAEHAICTRGHSITMLTREGGWVVCEMSTKVNKRWVHGSFMVNVDFQRIASSLFT